jgi:hypothetical protein
MKLDIGCGPKCLPDFVGVDRFPLPGVDIVTDLNRPLPLRDNSVEIIHASHSLEHVADIMFTMRELYRVCKHKAQICIVAPYYEQKLNLANPYHLQVFNEHTPRFWTHFPWAPINESDYYHPHAAPWGLSFSDHSNPGLDIRLLRMEFFYFPRFLGIDSESLRELRQNSADICHQVLYHLIVWKDEQDDDYIEITRHLDTYPFLTTPSIEHARAISGSDAPESQRQIKTIHQEVKEAQHQLETTQREVEKLHMLVANQENSLNRLSELAASAMQALQRKDAHYRETISFLMGSSPLSFAPLASSKKRLDAEGKALQLSHSFPEEGYLEYPISASGEFNTVVLAVYNSSTEGQECKIGVEFVSKTNQILWSGAQAFLLNHAIMTIELTTDQVLDKREILKIRVLCRNNKEAVHMIERQTSNGWPQRKILSAPYVNLLLNDTH